jgi:hypothetical protein
MENYMLIQLAELVGLVQIPFAISIFLIFHYRRILDPIGNFIQSLSSENHKNYLQPSIYIICIFYTLIFGFILTIIVFPSSDVDDAMVAAIRGFLEGVNPYQEDIVPHILLTSSGSVTVWGTYNYGPIDLIGYSLGYLLFSPFLPSNWWLFGTNFVLMIFIYLIFHAIYPDIHHIRKLIPFVILMSFFLQDNAVLMVLFLALAWWCYKKLTNPKRDIMVIIFLTLGSLTKLFLVVVLFAYIYYIIFPDIKKTIFLTALSLILVLIVLIPFNIGEVINSTLLFHSQLDDRESLTKIQGALPAILLIFGFQNYYIPLGGLLAVIFLLLAQKYSPIIDQRLIFLTIFANLLLPNSVYAFFMVSAFYFLTNYFTNITTDKNVNNEIDPNKA